MAILEALTAVNLIVGKPLLIFIVINWCHPDGIGANFTKAKVRPKKPIRL
ncbi:hypothetical protein [Pseudomonas asiatica]